MLALLLCAVVGGCWAQFPEDDLDHLEAQEPMCMKHRIWPMPLNSMKKLGFNVTLVNPDLPMYIFENFLSDDECDKFIDLATPGFERSTGGLERTLTASRTSSTAWLDAFELTEHRVLSDVENRIALLTNVPRKNQETFQALRYSPGEFYRAHFDYIPQQAEMPCGARVATFFLYLNDVIEGGETYFPDIHLKVKPRKGRAVLWYNVELDTLKEHPLSRHEALPVVEGVKYGSNKWIHFYNFYDAWKQGLTG